jgi:hypothetical protein
MDFARMQSFFVVKALPFGKALTTKKISFELLTTHEILSRNSNTTNEP